ncbi:hypothetical protein Vadar_009977 [Vaccinium darrowii]|uniref:Uncharacterized protein n=1 Tax=Vaccinium darrowii TaxID=229202 RepID=A0ACB7XGF4_9ERIC|nr:hypothetical protein Vadar_009977 [Vaccinium darrowii]
MKEKLAYAGLDYENELENELDISKTSPSIEKSCELPDGNPLCLNQCCRRLVVVRELAAATTTGGGGDRAEPREDVELAARSLLGERQGTQWKSFTAEPILTSILVRSRR